MIARAALAQAVTLLDQAGCETPRLDAEILLRHFWQTSATGLFLKLDEMLPEEVETSYLAAVGRRSKREPLAYITGEKEFWSLDFYVTQGVLIPRPETEHVIEAVTDSFPDRDASYRFCDIGTGSGCIAITLALEYPASLVVATDISEKALVVASKNAVRHDVSDRIVFRLGDMFDALGLDDGLFDAIVSNPPYVGLDELAGLAPELAYEPREALTDEADGSRYLAHLVDQSPQWLSLHGYLFVETGLVGFPEPSAGMKCGNVINDLAGYERVGIYQRVT